MTLRMSFLTRRMHSLDGLLRHKEGIQLYLSPPPAPALLLTVGAILSPFHVEDFPPTPLATPPASTPLAIPFPLSPSPFPLSPSPFPPNPLGFGAPPNPCAFVDVGRAATAAADAGGGGGEALAPSNDDGVSKKDDGVGDGVAGVGAAPGFSDSENAGPVFFVSSMVQQRRQDTLPPQPSDDSWPGRGKSPTSNKGSAEISSDESVRWRRRRLPPPMLRCSSIQLLKRTDLPLAQSHTFSFRRCRFHTSRSSGESRHERLCKCLKIRMPHVPEVCGFDKVVRSEAARPARLAQRHKGRA